MVAELFLDFVFPFFPFQSVLNFWNYEGFFFQIAKDPLISKLVQGQIVREQRGFFPFKPFIFWAQFDFHPWEEMNKLLALTLTVLVISAVTMTEASPAREGKSVLSSSITDYLADMALSFVDVNIGRQARATIGRSILGSDSDAAMKSLFVKLLEWLAGLIGDLVFAAKEERFISRSNF